VTFADLGDFKPAHTLNSFQEFF